MSRKFWPEPDHDLDDLTSQDYPDYNDDTVPQESAHAAEIPFDVDDDADPTLRLECSICGAPFATCECRWHGRSARGPVRWPEAVDEFESLHPKDADNE